MGLFISYSSRDRPALDNVLSALRRAHEEVWFDEELGAGEVWWHKILERIRSCDVFIFAMSTNSLESKPCLAELRYAQDLQKPILPVQIGSVYSMRVTPLAEVEAIDYQNPTVDSGIRLTTAVREAQERGKPLPSPLPEEPPVPFAYLMRLATTITGPELDPHQQAALLSELKTGLEEDGNDAAARRDITQLLRALRDRPDVTYRTRTDIENLLASIGVPAAAPGPAAQPTMGPGPGISPPQGAIAHPPNFIARPPSPPAGPPPGLTAAHDASLPKSRHWSKKWIIAAGAAATCVVAAVVAVVLTNVRSGPAPTPPPAPTPIVTPAKLDSMLLSADDVAAVMGASDMQASRIFRNMTGASTKISDPDCLGAAYSAQEPVYDGSGWSAVSDQTLQEARTDNPNNNLYWVDQTAVSFPSDDQAHAFLDKSADKWKECAGRTVTVTGTNSESTWTFGDLSKDDDKIAQLGTQEGAQGWACQHTLTAFSNAVIEAIACSDQVGDEATRITEQMVANAKG